MIQNKVKPFSEKILPEDVLNVVDFGLKNDLQSSGVAGLYNILVENRYAYLADEVGMGKTIQALTLCAILWKLKPAAKICVVVPRANLQAKWEKEYGNFISHYYRIEDNIVKDVFTGKEVYSLFLPSNLREFSSGIHQAVPSLHILKWTSFMKPIFLTRHNMEQGGEKLKKVIQRCGLKSCDTARSDNSDTYNLNRLFAKSLGLTIGEMQKEPFYDLVIVDEAQYLRNIGNQTNTVLRHVFGCPNTEVHNNVSKWLFLSATPLHSGFQNVNSLHEHYVIGDTTGIANESTIEEKQTFLKKYMVRRSRIIKTPGGVELRKNEYRKHCDDEDRIPSEKNKLSPVASLSMALVQRKLVQLLGKDGYRFKLGLLSSFETLNRTRIDGKDDFERLDSNDDLKDNAPDSEYIDLLSREFRSMFDISLPHPKLEVVAEQLAQSAFDYGEKTLVFCRRINTIYALQSLVTKKWVTRLEQRLSSLWQNIPFSLENGPELEGEIAPVENEGSDNNANNDNTENDEDKDKDTDIPGAIGYSMACAQNGWLFRYRRKFSPGGANELFFEENWLRYFHKKIFSGSESYELFLSKLIEQDEVRKIITEAYSFKPNVGRPTPVQRLRYTTLFILNAILRQETVAVKVGNIDCLANFVSFLNLIFCDISSIKRVDIELKSFSSELDTQFLLHKGFWEVWSSGKYNTPDIDIITENQNRPVNLKFRQIAKTLIRQIIRYGDRSIDLYHAEIISQVSNNSSYNNFEKMAENFLSSLYKTTLPMNCAFIKSVELWCDANSIKLVTDKCLIGNKDTLDDVVKRGYFKQFQNLSPVSIMRGGMDTTAFSIQQFNAPFSPYIFISTDVLKEGEDLHLFCDNICHYGISWTAGDLEQRVGRIDRFDSLMERKLRFGDTKIFVHYPHVVTTIEKQQIEHIKKEVKKVEETLDLAENKTQSKLNNFVECDGNTLYEGKESGEYTENKSDLFEPDFSNIDEHNATVSEICKGASVSKQEIINNIKNELREYIDHASLIVDDRIAHIKSSEIVFDWDTSIPQFNCCSVRAIDNAKPVVHGDSQVSTYIEYIDQQKIFIGIERFLFDPEKSDKIGRSMRRYLDGQGYNTHTVPMEIVYALKDDVWVVNQMEKKHKFEIVFDGIGNFSRFQKLIIYIYDGMLLVTSPVANRIDIILPHLNFKNDSNDRTFSEWISENNKKHNIGFFFYRNDGILYFSEKLYYESLNYSQIRGIIMHIACTADAYEKHLTAQDNF